MTDEQLLREALEALEGLGVVVGTYGINLPQVRAHRLRERASEEIHSANNQARTAIAKLEERLLNE